MNTHTHTHARTRKNAQILFPQTYRSNDRRIISVAHADNPLQGGRCGEPQGAVIARLNIHNAAQVLSQEFRLGNGHCVVIHAQILDKPTTIVSKEISAAVNRWELGLTIHVATDDARIGTRGQVDTIFVGVRVDGSAVAVAAAGRCKVRVVALAFAVGPTCCVDVCE